MGFRRPRLPGTLDVVDDFERASLGSNWTIAYPDPDNGGPGGAAQVQIIGSSDLGMTNGNQGFFLADWTGNTFNDNQYCEATISPEVSVDPIWAEQVYVRRNFNLNPAPRYSFFFDNDPNQDDYLRWAIKFDGVAPEDTRTIALSGLAPSQAPQPGDRLRIEIVGYTIKGFWNGILILEGTDTAGNKIASGRPGLAARLADGNTSLATTTKVWELFTAGNM